MSGVLVIVLIVIVGVGWRVFDVQRHPIRQCPSCKGTKKNGGSTSRRWGTCGKCGGEGEVRRFGASK